MMNEDPNFEAEITLPLSELQSVMEDPAIRELIDSCAINSPGNIGACVQEEILDVLVKKFGGDPVDLGLGAEVYTDIDTSGEPDVVPGSLGMAKWVEDDPNPPDSDECRPCALPITVQWYRDTLNEAGRGDLSSELVRIGETKAPLTVAETMDRIKTIVSDDVKQRLEEHDATTQANIE